MATEVILMQHGVAVSDQVDPARPLSEQGLRQVRAVVEFLSARACSLLAAKPAVIFHSTKLRSRQTAEIVAAGLGGHLRVEESLAPNADPQVFANLIANLSEQTVVAVGHLPHLARLVGLLLVGDPQASVVRLTNASPLCLRIADGRWTIFWYLPADGLT